MKRFKFVFLFLLSCTNVYAMEGSAEASLRLDDNEPEMRYEELLNTKEAVLFPQPENADPFTMLTYMISRNRISLFELFLHDKRVTSKIDKVCAINLLKTAFLYEKLEFASALLSHPWLVNLIEGEELGRMLCAALRRDEQVEIYALLISKNVLDVIFTENLNEAFLLAIDSGNMNATEYLSMNLKTVQRIKAESIMYALRVARKTGNSKLKKIITQNPIFQEKTRNFSSVIV